MINSSKTISGQIILLKKKKIVSGHLDIEDGKIKAIREDQDVPEQFILPGFVDAHIHIESSMLIPSEFARIAVKHGTVATVSDPHEIANVLGMEGIDYMINNGNQSPFKFYFGAPSCVPATEFETAGARIDPEEIEVLLSRKEICYLAEMMNYPGVVFEDPMVLEKIAIAKKHNRKIDGHAPGLRGEDCRKYISHGISTDHECTSLEEAKEKINWGMKILIREGSAAKNYEALIPLLNDYPESIMFCSDDKHPHELIHGHINELVVRSIQAGYPLFDVLSAAILNPIEHYGLHVGLLNKNDPADFIVVEDLRHFKILKTYIDGKCVYADGHTNIPSVTSSSPNFFKRRPLDPTALQFNSPSGLYRVIEVVDGQLITKEVHHRLQSDASGTVQNDINNDILKIVVASRYDQNPPAIAFVKGFGFKKGAIAGSVAHDSHNIIGVGCDDVAILNAMNEVIKQRGGLSYADQDHLNSIALPIAGLMSNVSCKELANNYLQLQDLALKAGSKLHDPFMTLSFCALLVIPELKLSDLGLFNGITFKFAEKLI